MRHRLARIEHQRVHHLLDLAGVHFRFPEIDRDVEVRAQVRSVERELGRMFQQLSDRDDLLQGRATLRKCEELAGKMRRVLGGLARFGKKPKETSRFRRCFDLSQPIFLNHGQKWLSVRVPGASAERSAARVRGSDSVFFARDVAEKDRTPPCS